MKSKGGMTWCGGAGEGRSPVWEGNVAFVLIGISGIIVLFLILVHCLCVCLILTNFYYCNVHVFISNMFVINTIILVI